MLPPSNRPESDRNLLFGILAVQLNFISSEDLVAGMNSWVLEKQKSLGQILLESGRLSNQQVQALEALIVQHVQLHGGEVERSLQALDEAGTVASVLAPIDDEEMQASVKKAWASSDDETRSMRPSPDGARYRRLRLHREGGMGTVSVAEDVELHREVALKEIKPERAHDRDCRLRFILEAEITGGLAHPGIVPVYGLGVYPDGRPYYAMRFIRGDTLKDAIDRFHAADKPGRDASERRLAFRQLLRRFVDVCNAVAYSHERGVLHRDLKPGNVMLGSFGETLVVDWGLARAGVESGRAGDSLSAEPALHPTSSDDLPATQLGVVLGTIVYMSPEQALGRLDLLGPTSDICSLGATLYVLLTGERPYSGKDQAQTLAKVQKGQFTPIRAVKPDTPPALAAICRKAMAFERRDRYQTALELAADVEHWLADEPVAAYPEPWTARLGRWSRRHRSMVVGAAVFLVSAVLALSLSTIIVVAEQRETEKQRQIAVANYQMARKQSFDIIRLIETSEPELASAPALHDRRKELLTTASDACRQFLRQEPDDLELQKQAAQIYRFTANFHRLTNETGEAERYYKDALLLREGLIKKFPQEAAAQLALADTERDHASLQLRQGRLTEAAEKLNRSLAIAERLKEDEKHPAYRRRVALACLNLAYVEYRQGKHKAGKTDNLKRAEELLRGLGGARAEERHPYDSVLLAAALNLAAMMEREAGQLAAAETIHKEAVLVLKGLRDRKLKMVNEADVTHFEAEFRVEQSRTWARIAKPKHLLAAEANLGLAINKLTELARDYPKLTTYRESLGAAFLARGQIREQTRDFKKAQEDFEQSQKLLKPLVASYKDLPDLRGDLGKAYAGLGRAARALGSADAAQWLEKAAAELRTAVAQSPTDTLLKRALADLPPPAP
jgi:serine/threonine-protein kinase